MSEEDFDEGEDLDVQDAERESLFDSLASQVEARCVAADLKFERINRRLDENTSSPFVRLWLPSGRNTQKLAFFRSEALEQLLSIPFERVTLLSGYDAVLDRENGRIEARVRSTMPVPTFRLIEQLASAAGPRPETETEARPSRVSWPGEGSVTLTVGSSSDAFLILSDVPTSSLRQQHITTFAIEGVETDRHDDAVGLLETMSNSVFFGLDLGLNISLQLGRRRPRLATRMRSRGSRSDGYSLEFPRHEYDSAPMSLYWYARSARGMPLLQFLAYYQVIEFYFPTYSTREAGRKIQTLLKDPTFRVDRDADIARMLTIVSLPNGGGYGSEREQLRATINECVDISELREFVTAEQTRAEFFSTPQKGLTGKKLNLKSTQVDLKKDVADLLYDIRCRIVHTKGAETYGDKLLLPQSPEADLLELDIELIQFLAQRVLIAASTPLRR